MQKQLRHAHLRAGFDAAAAAREHDHLDRWPFAQEIYGIATTGRAEWSVRIGIYGEWGSGKTSVLNFVRAIAKARGDVVVTFNPWRFDSTARLWKNFVDLVLAELELAFGSPVAPHGAPATKVILAKGAQVLPRVVGIWKTEAGNAVESGLEYLQRFFAFGPEDLATIRNVLGDRRIIILIDDLDRTDAKLVPQTLFALKEVMDVPGMAFVCAFDPTVVGEVLADVHSGFKDGLKFLDKIIDYPRWLPEATAAQLASLALTDAVETAPYVPREALTDAIKLLPSNPRAIRQFVRLLALLRPQIDRHADREIHWPILLAANVAKVRFPKLAPHVLDDSAFWHAVYQTSFGTEKRDDEKHALIRERLTKVSGVSALDSASISDMERCLFSIADKLEIWFGIPHESLMYQFHLAERPCAVTWKEFDRLVNTHSEAELTAVAISKWIKTHASSLEQREEKVFGETVDVTIRARLNALSEAAEATAEVDMNRHLNRAARLMKLLRLLVLDLSHLETEQPQLTAAQIKALFESFAQYFSLSSNDLNAKARSEEKHLMLTLATRWGPNTLPLVEGVGMERWEGHHDLRGAEWQSTIEEVRSIIRPKLASWMVDRFRDSPSFFKTHLHSEQYGYKLRSLLLDRESALWVDQRGRMLSVLRMSWRNEFVRQNAYDVLQWFDYLMRKDKVQARLVDELLKDPEVATALWSAVLSQPLSPRAVGSVQVIGERMTNAGLWAKQPEWWRRIVAEFGSKLTTE